MSKNYHRPAPKGDAQLRMFTPSIADVGPRDVREAMELPFLSLSKHKRTTPIAYTSPKGARIFVDAPPSTGIANIYDWDLIIYLVAVIRQRTDAGEDVTNLIEFAPGDFLDTVRRPNTKQYQDGILQSLKRLQATSITTNIREEDQEATTKTEKAFSWINDYEHVTKTIHTKNGPKEIIQNYRVELCSWLYQAAIKHQLILSIDEDYFLLTGGYERWLYRIVRKSAGNDTWTWKLRTLFERSGVLEPQRLEGKTKETDEEFQKRRRDTYKRFAYDIRRIVKDNDPEKIRKDMEAGKKVKAPIPGYRLSMKPVKNDYLLEARAIETSDFRAPMVTGETTHRMRAGAFAIDYETEDEARAKCIKAGLDYYAIFEEWKASTLKNKVTIKNPNLAFLAYVKRCCKGKTR